MNTARRLVLACLLVLGLCIAPPPAAARVAIKIFVDVHAAGANDGTTWANAFTSLQDALAYAISGDAIWVADGVYYPDVGAGLADNDRSLSFFIKEGVTVYGGFDSGETSLAARAWQTHRAILSGDLAQDDTTDGAGLVLLHDDQVGANTYSVVRFVNTTNAAVLDGFYITAGAAVGDGCPSGNGCGGGILVYSDTDSAGPVISNVVVSGCSAGAVGGGMAFWRAAALRLSNITLAGNDADMGGGLSLVYRGKAVIEGASIITNSALFGGGIDVDNSSQLHLSGASVAGNVSANNGGGLYLHYNTTTGAAPTAVLTDVLFLNNTASSTTGGGGGIAVSGAALTATLVTLQGNSAAKYGGGMYITNGTYSSASVVLDRVTMAGNHADYNGGALHLVSGALTMLGSTLSGNYTPGGSSVYTGGGVNTVGGTAVITGSLLSANTSYHGGGLAVSGGTLTVTNTTFDANTASASGGGLRSSGGTVLLSGVTLRANTAGVDGGGVQHVGASLRIANCTFERNAAGGDPGIGGGLAFQQPLVVENSIFRGNTAYNGGGVAGRYDGAGTFENILLAGNRADFRGGGIYLKLYDTKLLTITAATMVSNTAASYGALASEGSCCATTVKPVYLRNSVVWGNAPASQQLSTSLGYGQFTVDYSDVQGGWTGAGANNINTDPLLRLPANPGGDALFGTADDAYGDQRVRLGSPVINAGSTILVTLPTDLAGRQRIMGGAVDMGAYEFDPANLRPSAVAGPDQAVHAGTLVTLDGSGSTDPDGDLPLAYLWQQTGGAAVSLSSAGVVSPTFTAPTGAGVLTFTLTVTDTAGLADLTPDEVVITITNQAPLADAGPDQAVRTGALVTLDGTGSGDPEDDLPLGYAWVQTGGETVGMNIISATPTFTAPSQPGTLTFLLFVTDSLGLQCLAPDEVVITVEPHRLYIPLALR